MKRRQYRTIGGELMKRIALGWLISEPYPKSERRALRGLVKNGLARWTGGGFRLTEAGFRALATYEREIAFLQGREARPS